MVLADHDRLREEIVTRRVYPPSNLSDESQTLIFSLLEHDTTMRLGTQTAEQVPRLLL